MTKIVKDSFGYLGPDFQVRLVAQLLVDNRFAESIIDIIDPNYFRENGLKLIVSTIKETYQKYNIIPDIGSVEFRLLENITNEFDQDYSLAELKKVKDINLNDGLGVQEIAMKFCKREELIKSLKLAQSIIDKGDDEKYGDIEEILKKALQYGETKDNGLNVLENIDAVLVDDFRKPIPTGIKKLDEVMDGGLSKGELGIILAPFGVGKTTMITKIANTGLNCGKNVLQIFFEDTSKIIQRKHLACWSGIKLNDLSLHKEELRELVEKKKLEGGHLILKKFPSDGTTIPIIRQYVRKLIAQGFKPDIILLDYIDCVEPSKKIEDVNVGEGKVMRQFETLLSEFDMAGWTAVQGNRSSIGAEVVEANQMGGSIKKGQIGHFVVSIAKTLDQKENGTATMAILKSRFGKDGIVFQDIQFDNSTIQISMDDNVSGKTRNEYKKDQQKDESAYISNLLNKRKSVINTDTTGTTETIQNENVSQ
jgi:replicative DNA helicase